MVAKVKSFLSPLDLARKTWVIYKARFWTLAGISAIGFLSSVAALIITGGIGVVAFLFFHTTVNPVIAGLGVLLLIIFLVSLAVIWGIVGASNILVVSKWDESFGVKKALIGGKALVLPFLLTALLTIYIQLGSAFLFIVPSLVFSVWFIFWQYFVVLEKKSPLIALNASRELVRNRFWGIVWRLVAVHLPELIISMALSRGDGMASGASTLALQMLSIALQPFYFIYTFVLFKELRTKKEHSMNTISKQSKMLFLGLPLAGFAVITIVGFFFGPTLLKDVMREVRTIYQQQESTTPRNLKSGTKILNGLLLYYNAKGKYPKGLDEIRNDSTLPTIPSDEQTGLPYRYYQVDNGEDFKLCVPLSKKSEKCFTSTSKDFSF